MGNFLDKPVTAKELHRVEGHGIVAGAAAMQGWRATMEDAHALSTDITGLPGWAWFGVFDGHGGTLVSKECAASLLRSVTTSSAFKPKVPSAVEAGIKAGFLRLDTAMRANSTIVSDASGSTAITALISPTHIHIANCGDARAVLVRGGKKVFATKDHKPELTGERRRIEKAHGSVFNRRVNGDLAVSRALGDFSFKGQPQFAQEDQMVTCNPDITTFKRQDNDDFLILACDGLWDVVSSFEASMFVLSQANQGEKDMAKVASMLCDDAMRIGSRDNISVMVVAFPAGMKRTITTPVKTKPASGAARAAGAGAGASHGATAAAREEKK